MSIKTWLLAHEPFKPAHMGFWIRSRYFRNYVRPLKRGRVEHILDAGCGTGMYSRMLAAWFPEAHIRGVDIRSFSEWHHAPANVSFGVLDLRQLDEVYQYDLVVSIDVLEHIPENTEIVRRLVRALRLDGYLYIAIPSETEERHLLPQHLFSRFHEWEEHEHIGEQWTLARLTEIIRDNNLQICVSRHTFTFFGMLAWELEMLLHWRGGPVGEKIRILLMPFLKILGLLDILFPIGTGNNLVLAKKPLRL